MATSTRKLKLILTTLVVAVCGGLSYLTYSFLMSEKGHVAYTGELAEYSISFFDAMGRQLSWRDGNLALLLDPYGFYRNYPNQKSKSFTIDDKGCRFSGVRGPSKKLAVVIGGSTAFGQGLPADKYTFSSVLNSFDGEYFFYNCAVVGYASGQELVQMVHYLDRLDPDLYLVFDGWNDLFAPLNMAQSWPAKFLPIGYNGQFRVMEAALHRLHESEMRDDGGKPKSRPEVAVSLDREGLLTAVTEGYSLNIEKMRDFAASRGGEMMVVLQPDLGLKSQKSAKEEQIITNWGKRTRYLSHQFSDGYRELIAAAKERFREHGIRYLDMNDVSTITGTDTTLFFDPVHLNVVGHRRAAEQIRLALETAE